MIAGGVQVITVYYQMHGKATAALFLPSAAAAGYLLAWESLPIWFLALFAVIMIPLGAALAISVLAITCGRTWRQVLAVLSENDRAGKRGGR